MLSNLTPLPTIRCHQLASPLSAFPSYPLVHAGMAALDDVYHAPRADIEIRGSGSIQGSWCREEKMTRPRAL